MKKTLDLMLNHKWYDMIDSGEKIEEYRDLCPYIGSEAQCGITKTFCTRGLQHNNYTHVRFYRGCTSTMTFEIDSITIGKGRPEWGSPIDRDVFIIKLGKRL